MSSQRLVRVLVSIGVLSGIGMGSLAAIAQPIRLIEDVRRVDLTAGPDFRVGPREIDTDPAPFGSELSVSLSETETVTVDQSGTPDSYTEQRAAGQSSVIQSLSGGGLRVAALLTASNSASQDFSFFSTVRGARTASDLSWRFETDVPLTYEIRYGVNAGGDESAGSTFAFDGLGGQYAGFLGDVVFDIRQNDAGATRFAVDEPYTFPIDFSDGSGLTDVQATISRGYMATGELPAGEFSISAIVDAGHDGDDASGAAFIAFELVLTPVPEPGAAAVMLLVGGALLRRGGGTVRRCS